ncbi:(2Fe-2S)-binding protein [Pontibacterium granulatum]|uniref:(2Fe-2S)-binding protein n=1 Tax=Pontibacterium granulatum TaxID=2036029 RepID=UPI00249B5162|nr:(2Fe-2S)-binding protein [Pontibacterium granulatum]MDI3325849.1 (2Fe-2S)-binding protein [Pontibacterium granulatum]
MDTERKENDPTLVCTCNDLYIEDIQESIGYGEDEYREIFAVHGLQPRCGECQCHVEALVSESP